MLCRLEWRVCRKDCPGTNFELFEEEAVLVGIHGARATGCLGCSCRSMQRKRWLSSVCTCSHHLQGGCPAQHVLRRACQLWSKQGQSLNSSPDLYLCVFCQALELLLLKGECASDIARSFVSAFEFTPRATAKKLAEMYLNSLMGTRGISSINENEPVFHYNLSPTQNRSTNCPSIPFKSVCSVLI